MLSCACDSSGADTVGVLIFFAYLVPPSILFIPLASVIQAYGLFDSPLSLILVYPTLLIPFSTWLLMGYFKTIPYELEECALIDGASRWQILTKIIVPLAIPGMISAFIFSFTLCWNEFIYALTFLQSTPNKTVPVAIVNEFVDGDIYKWGSLMAGALVGSLPLVILYAFFVEHYVSAMTGAVKGVGAQAHGDQLRTRRSWVLHILVLGAAGMVGRKLTERLLRDGHLGKRDITRMTLQDVVVPAKPDKIGFPVDTVTCDFAVPGAAENTGRRSPRRDFPSGGDRLRRGRARLRQGLSH